MNALKRTLWGLIVVAVAAVGGWYGLKARKTDPSTPPMASPTRPAETVIELTQSDLLTVEPSRLTRSLPVTGTLMASSQTLVRARVSGDVIDLPVREGMSIKAGQLLARIDPTDFELRVNERAAQLRSAQAQHDQARRTLENNAQLLAKAFISQNAFDNARSAVEVAAATVEGAQAQLAQARKALADTRITAPMSGVIAQRFVQPGEKISPDGRIVSIVDLSRIEVEVGVPASDIASVRIGQTASIRIEGINQPVPARVLRINPTTAAGTRAVTVYLGLDQTDDRLRAGMFAQGTLVIDEREGLLILPLSALRDRGGQRYVYLIENDRIVERVVTPGTIDEAARAPGGLTGAVEIRAGLKAGDRIVRQNLGTLQVGSRVRVTPVR
ncbi:MAG: cation/multidrug efflux system, membrane-fusion component [Pseudomonadota bacterium]|jgi:RND family efflux transporter MFP subunit